MDKVIDGVDVSGCEFSCENPLHEIKHSCNVRGYEKDNGLHIHFKCKDNPNCYYKQLKRLEQENEELKQENEQLKKSIDRIMQNKEIKTIDLDIAKENVELKAENDRLKEDKEHYRKEAYRLADGLNKTENLAFTYKQALQEIRDIANKHDYWRGSLQSATNIINEILDKINSVIGEE